MAIITCSHCGNSISDRATACPKCGTPQQNPEQNIARQTYNPATTTSSVYKEQERFLDKFHWGAFTFGWIWAMFNGLVLYGLIALLITMFTSGMAGIIIHVIFGLKGNRWAWEHCNKPFEEYEREQRLWNRWAKIVVFGTIAFLVFLIILLLSMAMWS